MTNTITLHHPPIIEIKMPANTTIYKEDLLKENENGDIVFCTSLEDTIKYVAAEYKKIGDKEDFIKVYDYQKGNICEERITYTEESQRKHDDKIVLGKIKEPFKGKVSILFTEQKWGDRRKP
jgi:hypothetical protein